MTTSALTQLTVVVTCHNSGPLLQRALDSIRSQGPVRIVLVDDGSTKCACEELAPRYANLVHVVRPNGGQPAALNTGLSHVVTDFVAFLDDDDEWLPGKAERQLRLLASSGADAAVGGVVNVQEQDDVEVDRTYFASARVLGAVTARASAVRRVGPFAEESRHHCIVDWWLRAAESGILIAEDDEPALLRRIHGGNSGIVHREEARRDLLHHLHTHAARRRGA